MRPTTLLCLPLALLTSACLWGGSDDDHDAVMDHHETEEVEEPMLEDVTNEDVRQSTESPRVGWSAYGAPIASGNRLLTTKSFMMVAEEPETYDGTNMLITGTIEEVCPKKGCWMTLTAGDETMRVTFRDYGFFVPLDAAGQNVVIDGTFQIETVPADEARHYLEDAGKLEEAAAITGPVESMTFVADSVLIQDF